MSSQLKDPMDEIVVSVGRKGWWSGRGSGDLLPGAAVSMEQLFLAGLHALAREDAILRAALEIRPDLAHRQAKVSRGLGFWVFEHNLVYEIFKAWLPLADVLWEAPGTKTPNKYWGLVAKAQGEEREIPNNGWSDLAIADRDADRFSALFECKWWNSATDAVKEDLGKLAKAKCSARRFFIGFWLSRDLNFKDDIQQGKTALERWSEDTGQSCPDYVFVGRFETHAVWSRPRSSDAASHFVMAAIEVRPSGRDGLG